MTYESSLKSRYVHWGGQRVCQGDVIKDLRFMIGSTDADGNNLVGSSYDRMYAVVMSQDCDLESHTRTVESGKNDARSMLEAVLICPAYPIEQFKLGTHLGENSIGPLSVSTKELKANDKHKRYHVLKEDKTIPITELVIDFKEFYTVPYVVVEEARKNNYVSTVNELFRESLSQRFASYLSRIGLPELEDPTE